MTETRLHPDDIAAIASAVADKISKAPLVTAESMSRSEAMQFVKRTSDAGFDAFCKRHPFVKPNLRGIWSRRLLERAIEKDTGPSRSPQFARARKAA